MGAVQNRNVTTGFRMEWICSPTNCGYRMQITISLFACDNNISTHFSTTSATSGSCRLCMRAYKLASVVWPKKEHSALVSFSLFILQSTLRMLTSFEENLYPMAVLTFASRNSSSWLSCLSISFMSFCTGTNLGHIWSYVLKQNLFYWIATLVQVEPLNVFHTCPTAMGTYNVCRNQHYYSEDPNRLC